MLLTFEADDSCPHAMPQRFSQWRVLRARSGDKHRAEPLMRRHAIDKMEGRAQGREWRNYHNALTNHGADLAGHAAEPGERRGAFVSGGRPCMIRISFS